MLGNALKLMKEDKTSEDEYSILNLHKNTNETALDWKSFNKNKSISGKEETNFKMDDTSLDTFKKINNENLKRIELDNADNENISYKRLKMSKMTEDDFECGINEQTKEYQKLNPNIIQTTILEIDKKSPLDKKDKKSPLDKKDKKSPLDKKDKESLLDESKNSLFKVNVYQNSNKDSFHIEAVDISDIQDQPTFVEEISEKIDILTKENHLNNHSENWKNNINPQIKNILRERLSNIITPNPSNKHSNLSTKADNLYTNKDNYINNNSILNINTLKNSIFERKVNYEEYKNSSCIDQSTLDIIKNKLEEEINKTQPQKIQFAPELNNFKTENLLTQLKCKIQNESTLRKEIINLESVIRLQNLEIENLKRREFPKNNSVSLIQEGKSAIQKLRLEFLEMEQNHQSELDREKSKNIILSKEITNLKLMIDSLLGKLNKS